MTKFINNFLLFLFFILCVQVNAQKIRVIDNKGTRQVVKNNSVFSQNTDPNVPTVVAVENDLWFDTSTSPNTVKTWNGTSWLNISSLSNNWLVNGNTGTTGSNFLGTIDDVKMEIRSNNTPMLRFGRRQTLGLTQSYPDYNDNNQPLVLINGNGTTSALQFTASGASFYKPMFFTTTNGSFRLKGSSGGTDFFEIGSAGIGNEGRLEFTIADDGAEPIVFKRYDYRSGGSYRELFRVQGSADNSNAKTRFGININTQQIPIAGDIDANYNTGTFRIPNSTFEVNGSISKSITETTADFTLTEDNYSVVLGGNHNITLPNANTCEGRIYIIKNTFNTKPTISSYINNNGTSVTEIPDKSILKIQSDGTKWVQVSTSNINNWSLTGNTGTDPDAASNPNFLGTIDRKDLVLKTYNIERIRVGDITFAHQGEVLINNPTPNSFPRAHPLIIKGNGTSILSFEDSDSDDFWDWNFAKQGHLSIKQRANSAPSLVLSKQNNVGIAGNPHPFTTLDVHGKTRIRNLPAGNTTHSFVVAEPDGDLKSIPPSSVFSNVTQTVTNGNEIARHTAGGNTTVINETITTVVPVAKATTNDRTIATYENEDGSTSGVAIKESVTSITQATNNTNAQVSASTAKTIATYEDENGNDTNINESISTLAFRKVNNTSPTADQYFLDYKNETGVLNNIDISSLTYKGTKGSVLFIGDDTTIAEKNSQFFWDNDNNRLFIGNTASSWPTSISETKVNINGAVTSRSGFKANDGTASIPSFRFYNDANTGMFNAGTDALAFSTKATEALRIDDSQNVGIGTTTPSKKLDVNGELKVRTIQNSSSTNDKLLVADNNGVVKKYQGPQIVASGKVREGSSSGNLVCVKCYNATVTRRSGGGGDSVFYEVRFPNSLSTVIGNNYVIQLTIPQEPSGEWHRLIKYFGQNSNGFNVKIVDGIHSSSFFYGNDKRKAHPFMFTVVSW